MIEQYYVLQKIEQKHMTGWSYTKQYYVPFKAMTDKLVSEKKTALADTNIKVFHAVREFLDALEPVFEHRHKTLNVLANPSMQPTGKRTPATD